MKKKKSSGLDNISQECLILGADILTIPLTRIINCSIESGIFPEEWKLAVVTPLLKKGDPKEKSNYRPVSCLAAASKVLEKIVCGQLTRINMVKKGTQNNEREVRRGTRREMNEGGRTKMIQESVTRDTGRIWNRAPISIKDAPSIRNAKKERK